jgi:hypothetical protein
VCIVFAKCDGSEGKVDFMLKLRITYRSKKGPNWLVWDLTLSALSGNLKCFCCSALEELSETLYMFGIPSGSDQVTLG